MPFGSRNSLRSSPYPAIYLSDERLAVLVAALVVLEPHKLVDRQGIQPRAYLPDALLVVAGDGRLPFVGAVVSMTLAVSSALVF